MNFSELFNLSIFDIEEEITLEKYILTLKESYNKISYLFEFITELIINRIIFKIELIIYLLYCIHINSNITYKSIQYLIVITIASFMLVIFISSTITLYYAFPYIREIIKFKNKYNYIKATKH